MVKAIARLLWCAAGAAVGLGLVLWLVNPPAATLLLASFGGTAVFLFGLTRAPAAQPRAVFGGHLGGALIGVCCYQYFGDATWVYILALVLTLVFMLLTGTVHPPAGANPLLMLHAHAGFGAVLQPVGLGIVILALVAVAWSRALPGTVRYPTNLRENPRRRYSGGLGRMSRWRAGSPNVPLQRGPAALACVAGAAHCRSPIRS